MFTVSIQNFTPYNYYRQFCRPNVYCSIFVMAHPNSFSNGVVSGAAGIWWAIPIAWMIRSCSLIYLLQSRTMESEIGYKISQINVFFAYI